MKKLNIVKGLTILMLSGVFTLSQAGGTAAGTAVNNTATLSFGDTEDTTTDITSNTEQFVVDNKIDLTVTTLDVSAIQTKPGVTNVVLKYKVVNTGNNVQDFDLAAITSSATAFTGDNEVTDDIDADNVRVFVDVNDNGTFEDAEDTLQYLDELGIDAEKIVFIVVDIPADKVNGNVAVYDLQAQVAESGTEGTKGAIIAEDDRNNPDNALTVQIVFADGVGSITGDNERDGKHSSVDALIIVIADMSITKISFVVSDPINATTNPKRIPGATLRYCFTITNNGDAEAAVAKISDDLDEARFVVADLDNNNIRIYDGADEFVCADAATLTTNANTGTVNTTTGEIVIDLLGVPANSSKSAYLDLVLQ